MLTIIVGPEGFDESNQEIVTLDGVTLKLEHSLVSLSKWEAIHEKPFLTEGNKTPEELISYVKCMTVTRNVLEEVYDNLSEANMSDINEYMQAKMTATTFRENSKRSRRQEIVTSEIIYHWMIINNIPSEFEKWHLNRLLALIRVCDVKNSKPTKMSRREAAMFQDKLNRQRLKELGTSG